MFSFIPTKQESTIGQDVVVKFKIKNLGTNTLAFYNTKGDREKGNNQYNFTATYNGKDLIDIGNTDQSEGRIYGPIFLQPGEEFKGETSLKQWFSFQNEGIYEINGSYSLVIFDPNSEYKRVIWEEDISENFIVKIKRSTAVLTK